MKLGKKVQCTVTANSKLKDDIDNMKQTTVIRNVVIHCTCLHGVLGDSTLGDASLYSAEHYAKYFKDKMDSMRASTSATPTYDSS